MSLDDRVSSLLLKKFPEKHVKAALNHFGAAVTEFRDSDWEGTVAKVGKFVEAVVKGLYVYCGQTLPPARKFKVGVIVNQLSQLDSATYSDTVRLLIPRACTFVYDIGSNRGARHDPDEIDPNKMDAAVAVPVAAWILSEMIRFADSASLTPDETAALVDELMEKKYPYAEEIDGRTYINVDGFSAPEIGLLLLNEAYPKRVRREILVDQIARHHFKKTAANTAATRLRRYVDDDDGNWKLRGNGRQKAAAIQAKL